MKRKRSFWRWLVLWARAGAFEEARKKRIMRENLETWNRYNRGFIRKCEREDDTAGFDNSSADESSVIISASIATTMMSDSGDGDGD